MSWVRQYLVLHTGNRVDAVLGTRRSSSHLLALPLRYFEHRPTGVLVARLHGVETIREFVSGAAVTLILDLPFLLIFLAIMFYYSWLLSLIALGVLGADRRHEPRWSRRLLRARLNEQFLLGARNQAFLTEYVVGHGDGEIAADGAAARARASATSSRLPRRELRARGSSPTPTTSPPTRSSSC